MFKMIKIKELPVKSPPFEVFKKFYGEPYSFFLDSCYNIFNLGNFSFIGFNPSLVIKGIRDKAVVESKPSKQTVRGNPFDIFEDIFKNLKVKKGGIKPVPFTCGFVGYFGYDLRRFIFNLPDIAVDDISVFDYVLCFYECVLGFTHKSNSYFLCFLDTKNAMNLAKKYERKLFKENTPTFDKGSSTFGQAKFKSNFTKHQYIKAVNKVKKYIQNGDVCQVNLSQRFKSYLNREPILIYEKLRQISPSPFSSFLNFNDIKILSSSPERFLKLSGGVIETRPMKGTRPRGKDKASDLKLKNDLLRSKKDKMELMMIANLLRNELAGVSKEGLVKIKHPRQIEKHPTVFQTTSTITGILQKGKNWVDLLKACFPGGSVTGYPKPKAMEIIEEIEPTKRKIYTGALGYIDVSGDMDLSMIIRTILMKKRSDGYDVYFQVGGGIVADSEPEDEYEETLHKAYGMFKAIEIS